MADDYEIVQEFEAGLALVGSEVKAMRDGKVSKYHRAADIYDYVVLESVDYPTRKWEEFLGKRYGKMAKSRPPLRPLYQRYDSAIAHFDKLVEGLPARQLYRLCTALIGGSVSHKAMDFGQAMERFKEVVEGADRLEGISREILPLGRSDETEPVGRSDKAEPVGRSDETEPLGGSKTDHWHWLHLLELWDYFRPPVPSGPPTPQNASGKVPDQQITDQETTNQAHPGEAGLNEEDIR